MVKFDVKSAISCKVMILYLDFVVGITSYVQTLLLDHVLILNEVYFQISPQTPYPFVKTPRLSGTE